MCGINGYYKFDSNPNDYNIKNIIDNMNSLIAHRGPDDFGVYVDTNIGLGMRRLAIIDLEAGHQPIFNEDKSKIIVFNGEIYNFKELREELINLGHIFTTKTDTEVVLHSYEEYGVDCLLKFRGMFAFAIYNRDEKNLFLARDRSGEKPLYYCVEDERLFFSSEMKSFLPSIKRREINNEALVQYFQLTYIPSPLTIYENVYKLEAATYMIVESNGSRVKQKYWDYEYSNQNPSSYNEMVESTRKTITEAIEECMVSDVPIGAFLSGGIDSAIIVGTMSKLAKQPIETFTITFDNHKYDESKYAKLTSVFNNTNHNVIKLTYENLIESIDYVLANFDEPFADDSALPTYLVSKYAAKKVKVCLTGDAGDELFAGYSKYLIEYYSKCYSRMPKWVKTWFFEKIVYSLPDRTPLIRKIKKVIENQNKSDFDKRYDLMCLGFKRNEIGKLLCERTSETLYDKCNEIYTKTNSSSTIDKVLSLDYKVVLEGSMLVKVDRTSMLCSLETRVPFLNPKVINLASQLPDTYKINNRRTKKILRDAFKELMHPIVFKGKKKGFSMPIADWFRSELKEEIIELTSKELVESQRIFNHDYIQSILEEHFSIKKDRSRELWAIYVFQKWYIRFMENIE